MITDKFKDTALSFAGCDGGNLKSDVWFCGLEWGGEQKNTLDLLLTKTVFILGLTKILMGVGWLNIIKRSAGSYGIFTVWNGMMVKIVRFL
ncbi:hypothetical protein FXB78_07520 [Aggregatibacter actinomycetemcomitans]|uniref:hypothetical protein n=1 Tax=Aggregatibacter actinomycetemcomitans TaxID=714 RepID=UPI0011D8EA0D|nr:hypothetical protein [Aggregatibacter actinomycetemcomitans]TYA50756.1 hypothetical protein FXB81_07585 [Aggregatibacter actinomycetemcomitans]TYB28899.1 hypothetical protein FXB78_07520 [Aggregatibacter actinomycetemcomitans]